MRVKANAEPVRQRLASGDVAAWLLKTSVHPAQIQPGWLPGHECTLERCLARSYRLSLMTSGQACVLWLSGRVSPGVHAIGQVVGEPSLSGPPDVQPVALLSLRLLAEPVARSELVAHPDFAGAEVLRIAAGSNPSYLDRAQLAAVLELARLPSASAGE